MIIQQIIAACISLSNKFVLKAAWQLFIVDNGLISLVILCRSSCYSWPSHSEKKQRKKKREDSKCWAPDSRENKEVLRRNLPSTSRWPWTGHFLPGERTKWSRESTSANPQIWLSMCSFWKVHGIHSLGVSVRQQLVNPNTRSCQERCESDLDWGMSNVNCSTTSMYCARDSLAQHKHVLEVEGLSQTATYL